MAAQLVYEHGDDCHCMDCFMPGALRAGWRRDVPNNAHYAGCGCVQCIPPVNIVNVTAQETMKVAVERQIHDLLRTIENNGVDGIQIDDFKSWHGGREITEGADGSRRGCTHRHFTKYTSKEVSTYTGSPMVSYFCHDCGQTLSQSPSWQ